MSAPGLSLIWVRKRTVAKARSWPGAGDPSVNFIAREPSLGALVVTGRFRARISKSWLVRLGQERVLRTVRFRRPSLRPTSHATGPGQWQT